MRRAGLLAVGLLLSMLALPGRLIAGAPDAAADPTSARIPEFFDPDHRVAPPDLAAVRSIRFLTTDDFPPFHFALPDGTLAGFDIDLARAICRDLKLACTIQARRFDTLVEAIKSGKDDALIAAVANTPATRADLTFTDPYYTTPARFAVALPPHGTQTLHDTKAPIAAVTPEALAGRVIGVEDGTAHAAYLKTFFPAVVLKSYHGQPDLRAALQLGEVDAVFADGIGLALWLNGADAKGCCAFRGGPFTESRFFGNGVSIAVAKDNVVLRQALNFELAKLTKDGTYADLYLKYFPISFY